MGSEAIADGTLTSSQLSTGYTRLFRDVYVHRDVQVTAALRAKAGWLWTKRQGLVAGFSAAAMHGSKWVDDTTTVDLIHENRHRLPGLFTRGDRIEGDEITVIDGVPVTTPTRTALDLGCWYPMTTAVAAIDSLARATEIKAADVELLAQRYAGRRGIAGARLAITLFDAGARPPRRRGCGWSSSTLEYRGRKHRSRCVTSQATRLHTLIWVGRTSKSRWSMTATNIAPTGINTTGMCGDRNYFIDLAGP